METTIRGDDVQDESVVHVKRFISVVTVLWGTLLVSEEESEMLAVWQYFNNQDCPSPDGVHVP